MVDGKKTNEEMFADWLAENIPYTRLPELYLCYSEIERLIASKQKCCTNSYLKRLI